MLEKSEGTIDNGKFRDTGHTRHKTKKTEQKTTTAKPGRKQLLAKDK